MAVSIIYRATVEAVSTVDVSLAVLPHEDGEEAFVRQDERTLVNIPGASGSDDVDYMKRAFGSLIGIKGAVKITIEPDPDFANEVSRCENDLLK